MLQAGLHRRQFDEFSALLGEQREDNEQTYRAALRAPKWEIGRVEPSLKIEHTHNYSNVDWLDTCGNSEVGLQFEKRF